MKAKKKIVNKQNPHNVHIVFTGYTLNEDYVAKFGELFNKQSFLSVSILLNRVNQPNDLKSKNNQYEFVNSLNEIKTKLKNIEGKTNVFIVDMKNGVSDIQKIIKLTKDSDFDIILSNKGVPSKYLLVKDYIFSIVDWSDQCDPTKSLDRFLRRNYNEARRYTIYEVDKEGIMLQPVEGIFGVSFLERAMVLLQSLFVTQFSFKEFIYKRGNTIYKEPVFFKSLFVIICVVLFFLMPLLSLNKGISGDEDRHVEQSEKVYSFFVTHGADTSYMVCPYGPFYAYNITFDVFLHILIEKFNVEDYYELRHVITAITGYLTILFCGLLVVYIAGWRAGVISVLLLLFSPRFLGHTYNNPKDIPFAMCYIFTIYYMVKFINRLPKVSVKYAALLALGIGATLNIRVGGLLLIAYLFLFTGLHVLTTIKLKYIFTKELKYVGKLILTLITISAIGYTIGFIFWPYGLEDPLKNPFNSLEIMTNFKVALKQTFEGEVIWSDNVPWYYTGKYMLISIPIVVLAGLLIYFVTYFSLSKKYGWLKMFILLFGFLFPLIYIIYRESNVYGGWRHMNFTYILIVASAAIAINHLFYIFKSKYIQYSIFGLLFIGLLHPIIHTFKNHPYQYIYFNQLAGGVNGAYGNYEMDYYYHSLKESSRWLINNKIDTTGNKKTIVATNHAEIVKYYFSDYLDHVTVTYVRFYDRGNYNWDYAVIANSYINPYQQRNGYWPPANTIHEVKVDKAVVGAVIERKDKNDFHGYQAMKEKNYFKAELHLKKALEANPNNEVARINLAKIYIDQNRLNEANGIVNGTLKIYENYDKALNLLGIIYLKKREFNHALGVFNRITQVNPKFVNAYHNIGVVLLNQKKNEHALDYFRKALKVNSKYKPSYMAIAHILRQAGKEEEAQRYVDAANRL